MQLNMDLRKHNDDGTAGRDRHSAAQWFAQLVSGCDLLRMELGDNARSPLGDKIASLGKRSLDLSRKTDGGSLQPWQEEMSGLLEDVEAVQQLAGETGSRLRGEDLLQLEVAALELRKFLCAADLPAQRAAAASAPPRILFVDDDEANRDIFLRLLRRDPWRITIAANGMDAIALAARQEFDLILLDVLMPGMDGLTVLRRLRQEERLRSTPIVMISGVDETHNVAACLEAGANDFVFKPFNLVLLRARIGAALQINALLRQGRDQSEKMAAMVAELDEIRRGQQALIEAILPARAAEELRLHGAVAPRYHNDVTVMFTDFAGFTASCSSLTAYELVQSLDGYFTAFDQIAARFGLERLKTVGDAYVCVCGLDADSPSNPIDTVLAAIEMLDCALRRGVEGPSWPMRIGINTGPVVSGVVGKRRFAFDIWGDTVNVAARVCSGAEPGRITASEKSFQRVKEFFQCRSLGLVGMKGKREAELFAVEGPRLPAQADREQDRAQWFRRRYLSYFGREPTALPAGLFEASRNRDPAS